MFTSKTNTVKKLAPIQGEDNKIEVSIVDDTAVIKLFSWVEGLGWTCQKTIGVDGTLLEDLHRSLAAARRRLCKDAIKSPGENVIRFPAVS
jgi:hypothetical protein